MEEFEENEFMEFQTAVPRFKRWAAVLWKDSHGFVVSTEYIIVATIIALGLIAGLAAIRDGIVSEISDVAGSVQDLNQSYHYNALTGHSATNVGSDFQDSTDFCDDNDDASGQADNCIRFTVPPIDEGRAPRRGNIRNLPIRRGSQGSSNSQSLR
jgi:Flp pilus assembly pilin Flp